MPKIKFSLIVAVAITLQCVALAQQSQPATLNAPGSEWKIAETPEKLGLSRDLLRQAEEYAHTLNTAAVIIVVNGEIAYQWGETEKKFNSHSIRKSILSALYGKYVRNGMIDLEATMAELQITDTLGLTEEELKATVRDCLKSRSGIYHPALYESASMKRLKPERHTQRAGTHWYYNNWDFNALGTIFEQQTQQKIFDAIATDIAAPIGMQDYTPTDGTYITGPESIHPAYPIRLSARDLARFGLLMLNQGNWNGTQVIDRDWIEESTRYHSDATLYSSSGYSYLWWVARDFNKHPHLPNVKLPEGTYSARGAGGHHLVVLPTYNMVIVHRVNTDIRGNRVTYNEFGTLLSLILEARIETNQQKP